MAGRLKAWLVALVLWAVLLPVLGLGGDDAGSRTAIAGGGALFLYLLLVFVVRISWPVRVVGADAARLVGGAKTYALHRFRGVTHSVGRSIDSSTSVDGSVYTDAMGDVRGRIDSTTRTTVEDRFSLTASDGRQHAVQIRDAAVPIGSGQLVTAVWAIAPGRQRGDYIAVVNHSTGTTTWVPKAVYRIIYGGHVGWGVLWAFLSSGLLLLGGLSSGAVVFVLAMVWFIIVTRLQFGWFRSAGSRPLVRSAVEQAAGDHDALRRSTVLDASTRSVAAASGTVPMPPPTPAPTPMPTSRGVVRPGPPPPARWETAAWVADPTHRHEFRFWDGSRWTSDVSDAGVQGHDPL